MQLVVSYFRMAKLQFPLNQYRLKHKEITPRAIDNSSLLIQCLEEIAANSANHPVVIAIDALDEASQSGLAPSANSLYLPSILPKGVYVLITTRPLKDMRLHVTSQQVFNMISDSEENLQDITTYIKVFTQRKGIQDRISTWGVTVKQFVAALRKKSQGNFMYLYYVLPAIESGEFHRGTLDELPDGLMAYYQRHWRQIFEGNEREFNSIYEPIICILGVAQEPITIQQIASWTCLNQGLVKKSILLWREFLTEVWVNGEHRYRIYHASFQDFLKECVNLAQYDDMIATYYLSLIRSV
ncbi:hypothetical protein [Neptuniibacter sp.]|uniref:hypothetical protein n=1 Tax=Neptuniibacter sp. TaxID=1962643 RepID=UPI00262340E6|nr:hypothetical protein [Neptuniibacter sp.]MCP4594859.1 hypothetical protein [Neptuniibacter sp.]